MKKTKKTFSMNDDYYTGTEPSNGLDNQLDEIVLGLSGAKPAARVYLVDIQRLEPYPDQPFKLYPPERLEELAEDIARVGILSPILTRRYKNKLQILAGHNRLAAARIAGLKQVPVLILDADDEQAVLILTGTNLRQRDKLLHSEKAYAYKMQMEALNRQGKSGGHDVYDSSSFITRQTGDSRMQIYRYVRLAGLEPELLDLLDKGRIGMTPAVYVSYLDKAAQKEVVRYIHEGAKLTMEKGGALKALADKALEEKADAAQISAQIERIMLYGIKNKQNPNPKSITLKYDRIRRYLPKGLDREREERWIINALKAAARKAEL